MVHETETEPQSFFEYLEENVQSVPEIFDLTPATPDDIQMAMTLSDDPMLRPTFLYPESDRLVQVVPVYLDNEGNLYVWPIYTHGVVWGETTLPSVMYTDDLDQEHLMYVSDDILEKSGGISDEGTSHVINLLDDPFARSLYISPEGFPYQDELNRGTSELLYQIFDEPSTYLVNNKSRLPSDLVEAYYMYSGSSDDTQVPTTEIIDNIQPDPDNPGNLLPVTQNFDCKTLEKASKWSSNSCYVDNLLFVMFHPELGYYEDRILNVDLDYHFGHPKDTSSQKIMQNMCGGDESSDLSIKKEIQALLRQDVLNIRTGAHKTCNLRSAITKCVGLPFPENPYSTNDAVQDVMWPLTMAFGVDPPFKVIQRVCQYYSEAKTGPVGWRKSDAKMIPDPGHVVILPVPKRRTGFESLVNRYMSEINLQHEELSNGTVEATVFERYIPHSQCIPMMIPRRQMQQNFTYINQVEIVPSQNIDVCGIDYELVAVLIILRGHYNSCIKCRGTDHWYYFQNDPSHRVTSLEVTNWNKLKSTKELLKYGYLYIYMPTEGPDNQDPLSDFFEKSDTCDTPIDHVPNMIAPQFKQRAGANTADKNPYDKNEAEKDNVAANNDDEKSNIVSCNERSDVISDDEKTASDNDDEQSDTDDERDDAVSDNDEEQSDEGADDEQSDDVSDNDEEHSDDDTDNEQNDDIDHKAIAQKGGCMDNTDGISGKGKYVYYHSSGPSENLWLDNTSDHSITVNGRLYPTVEHYYNFMKYLHGVGRPSSSISADDALQMILEEPDPLKVRKMTTRSGILGKAMYYDYDKWLNSKDMYLYSGRLQKLLDHPSLKDKLLKTLGYDIRERIPTLNITGHTSAEINKALGAAVYYDKKMKQWYGNPDREDTWVKIRNNLSS